MVSLENVSYVLEKYALPLLGAVFENVFSYNESIAFFKSFISLLALSLVILAIIENVVLNSPVSVQLFLYFMSAFTSFILRLCF